MGNVFKYVVPIVAAGFLLAGCSFEDLFAKLATTNEEAGARQEYELAKQAEAKMAVIKQKQQQFPESVEMKNVSESTKYVAFAFKRTENAKSTIEVEAILPNPGKQLYEVWLRGKNTKDLIDLGAMQFNKTDDYSLKYSTEKDLSGYTTILLSRESTPDATPEAVLMSGTFATK